MRWLFRFGFVDLFVVVVAVVAVWSRTPVGALGQWGVAWVRGHDTSTTPSLLAFFRSEAPVAEWADQPIALPDTAIDVGDGLPEPYRSAVRHGLPDPLPAATLALVGEGTDTPADRLIAWLDEHWEGDPEGALERAAIGDELRQRAIERASATGVEDPERFANHRRFLSQQAERDAAALVDGVMGLSVVLDLRWPVDDDVRISSPFGYRIHPVLKTKKLHNGVDLPVPIGTPLHAAQSGEVIKAGEDSVSGKFVILQHAGGISTAYCHMSELFGKSAGDRVSKGETIGKSGNTGRSTGPHLHFILRLDGEAIDPAPYRRGGPR
ncbi:MAG: M23 family metallopeptidase [Alphaproteobacteria bacterium]|nr:M23 family metallopeptidase [Alphaproteobacteria bacterium]MCB9692703.1 M23 family metallopeptidase [Alphaproteobacteria bacterium]